MKNKTITTNTLKHSQSSFTLIELLVVIAIIGILAGVLIVSFGGTTNTARDARDKAQLASLRDAILAYGIPNNFTFPVSNPSPCNVGDPGASGCAALAAAIPNLPRPVSGTGYYQYISNGTSFSLRASLSENSTYSVDYYPNTTINDCPSGYIDTGHGFCVMQFEARDDGSGHPVSQTGAPWASITQTAAIAACSNLGPGYHLLTNTEWMLIANDVLNVGANWSGSAVGSGKLKIGNNGTDEANVSYNGPDPDTGTHALATLTLANTKQIYHFSGNVYEWTNDTRETSQLPNQPEAWREINTVSWTTALPYNLVGPFNPTYATSSYGVGQVYTDNNDAIPSGNIHAFLRGGNWDNGSGAGVFALNLSNSPASARNDIGFRCAR